MDVNQLNGLSLAYIGDAIYELIIREHVLSQGYQKVNDLHKRVTKYTSGKSQANAIHYLLENNILTEQEISIFKRGRNSHVHTSRKNIDLQVYLDGTGFEALIGYLHLTDQKERMNEIIQIVLSL